MVLALCQSARADDASARTAEIKQLMRAHADAMIAESRDDFDRTLAAEPLINLSGGQAPSAGYSIQTDLMNPSKVVFGETRIGWAGTWGPTATLLEGPGAATKLLGRDPATVAFGTSAADRGFGVAAAARLMKRWAKLPLQVVDSDRSSTSALDEHLEVTIGDASVAWAQVRMKTQKPAIVLAGVAITRHTAAGTELLVFAYGAGD